MNHRYSSYLIPFIAAVSLSSAAYAAPLKVTVEGIAEGKTVPVQNALCKSTPDGKSEPAPNIRPTISWSGAPSKTKSFAVFMMDPDVPADFTDAGKEGKMIPEKAKRQDFFHWGVVGIPAHVTRLEGGDARKKPAHGTQLVNNLGSYVPDPTQFGGPCPPWNDERLHRYRFIVFALDQFAPVTSTVLNPTDDPEGNPNSAKNTFGRLASNKHVLERGSVTGTYSLYAPKK